MPTERFYGRRRAPEDPARCVAEVQIYQPANFTRPEIWRQCHRRRGHGPEGAYCWQHAQQRRRGKHQVFVPGGAP
jgi:hypothetical protein